MDILAEINEIANEYVGDVNLKLDDTFDSLDFDSLDDETDAPENSGTNE